MLLVAFLSSVVMTVIAVQYSNHVDQESNQRWCGLMSTLDTAYSDKPPSTDTGRRVAAEIKKLRHEFSC